MRRFALPVAALAVVATATAALAAPPPHAGRPADAGRSADAGRPAAGVTLERLGSYESGVFDESAAEIVAHDPGTQTLFVVNANASALDVLDISDPEHPDLVGTVESSIVEGVANSVAVAKGLVAVAVAAAEVADENDDPNNGVLELYRATDLVAGHVTPLAVLTVGSNPDMVTFTPNGRTVLVANEGEPNDDYSVDPEGSVSVVDLPGNPARVTQDDVRTAGFEAFEDALPEGVRVFGPGATVAKDLEPEYVTVTGNGRTAFVALQENNALAVLDVRTATITDLLPLGTKDHSLAVNALDASNKDDAINITTWPVNGLYQPDSIATYRVRGSDYVVTANEGDARDYVVDGLGFSEEARVKDLTLCPHAFGDAAALQLDANLGRLKITTTLGLRDGADDCYEELFSYGARSFSIFDEDGNLVFDSGDDFEQIVAARIPRIFNANNDETPSFDARSDDKGPEPEAVALGRIEGRTYAFIGLERVGGIMVYDVTDPHAPRFLDYVTTREVDVDFETDGGNNVPLDKAGDLGPEGFAFIDAKDSPTGRPMLAVGHEVSGTTVLFDVVPMDVEPLVAD